MADGGEVLSRGARVLPVRAILRAVLSRLKSSVPPAVCAALVLAALTGPGCASTAVPAPNDDRSRPLVYVFVLDGLDGDRVRQRRPIAPLLNASLDGRGGARSTLYEELAR